MEYESYDDMIIRPETVADYAAIGALHARAFGNRSLEATIVALLRQRRAFDPELSLVAEMDGRVVGHALFSPYAMRLLGETIPTVNLAPLAVEPAYQSRGIGGQLIREGHSLAAGKGYTVSILLGHPTYYPRFGYHQRAYGVSRVVVPIHQYSGDVLDTHSPTSEDIPALQSLWQHEEGAVDMTLEPGPDLLDWLSPNPAIQATVYTHDEEIVGYTRTNASEPEKPRIFLARDHTSARAIVATMAQSLAFDAVGASQKNFVLPLHPFSASTGAFGEATCDAWDAGMACSLSTSPLDDYLALVQSKQRPPGRVIWPVAFELE